MTTGGYSERETHYAPHPTDPNRCGRRAYVKGIFACCGKPKGHSGRHNDGYMRRSWGVQS